MEAVAFAGLLTIAIGLVGWALVQAVKLTVMITKLESSVANHEARLKALEDK